MGAANVSSATVRNEMVALADANLLEQPHTSAGRVPTARAFRMFVDRLGTPGLSVRAPMQQQTRDEIDARFVDVAGTQAVLERTSHVLATLSSGGGRGDCGDAGRRSAGACAFFTAGGGAGAGRGGDARRGWCGIACCRSMRTCRWASWKRRRTS